MRLTCLLVTVISVSGCLARNVPKASFCETSPGGYCETSPGGFCKTSPGDTVEYGSPDRVEYPDVERCSPAFNSLPPRSMADGEPTEFWDLSLQEVINTALRNSPVLRDLGGQVLSAPQLLSSIYDPAITQSHPRFGEEAALSAFDA